MIKKKNISQKDIDTWQDYIKNPTDVFDKEKNQNSKNLSKGIFKYDLHGYSLAEANKKAKELILFCVENNYQEILLITGKGIHSDTDRDIYISKDLSKLRFSVPDFINSKPELMRCVEHIRGAEKIDGGEGAIVIRLKKVIK